MIENFEFKNKTDKKQQKLSSFMGALVDNRRLRENSINFESLNIWRIRALHNQNMEKQKRHFELYRKYLRPS